MPQSLASKDIQLTCNLTAASATIAGDRDRLQQIVLNLLTNAVQFTPPGGSITVNLQTLENQVQIVITDTGCGIDAKLLPHIFAPFRQSEGAQKGLGLGLAIAQHLVELHGGNIHAQSPGVGQGATFIITLPWL